MKQRNVLFAIAAFAVAQLLFSCSPSANDGFAKRKYFDYKWDKKEYAKVETEKKTVAVKPVSKNETVIAMEEPALEAPAAKTQPVVLAEENTVTKEAAAPAKKKKAETPAIEKSPVMGVKEGDMNFAEKMLVRKIEKIAEKQQKKNESQRVETIVLVILAILIPPLAVFLAKGIGTEFWISLILTLLFFLPGVIYSLIVVLT